VEARIHVSYKEMKNIKSKIGIILIILIFLTTAAYGVRKLNHFNTLGRNESKSVRWSVVTADFISASIPESWELAKEAETTDTPPNHFVYRVTHIPTQFSIHIDLYTKKPIECDDYTQSLNDSCAIFNLGYDNVPEKFIEVATLESNRIVRPKDLVLPQDEGVIEEISEVMLFKLYPDPQEFAPDGTVQFNFSTNGDNEVRLSYVLGQEVDVQSIPEDLKQDISIADKIITTLKFHD
jgi:hypothetical protein